MEQEEKFSVAGVRGPGGKRGGEYQGIIRARSQGALEMAVTNLVFTL